MKLNFFDRIEISIKRINNHKRNKHWYRQDFDLFKRMNVKNSDFIIQDNYPILDEKQEYSGTINGAYFHQDLYVAKQIYLNSPDKHVDIGSRIDGFVAHVAVFRKIEVLDIRNLESEIENISFTRTDLMSDSLSFDNYCDSVSCLHALEHFGLGRYGDHIDPLGHLKGFANITKILKKNGLFYFSVPIGIQRIEFNAHRIFNLRYLISWVTRDFDILTFSYIDDKGYFHENIELTEYAINSTLDCKYGCGIFVLSKK